MSISNGIFTAEDGTKVRLASVDSISPLVESDQNYYDVTFGRHHVSVKETYLPRATFVAEWELT